MSFAQTKRQQINNNYEFLSYYWFCEKMNKSKEKECGE